MLKVITSVFIVTIRLEKHSVLKFIRFQLNCLGTVTYSLFSLVFFNISCLSLCVGYLTDHVYISLAFDFLASAFWYTESVL